MMKRLLSLTLALCMALSCLVFASAEDVIIMTDMAGREIKLNKPATRVVALQPADVEILYAVGAGDTLVGRGQYCDYPEECLSVPVVNSGAETSVEDILALEPEVVIMTKMSQTEEQIAQLEAAGVTVVVTDAQTLDGVYEAIDLISCIVGENTAGALLVATMIDGFDALSERALDSGKTVYFEVSPLEWGLWTAGGDTFMDEIATIAGLTNCFGDLDGWQEIDQEQVLKANPHYIVTITMYDGEGPRPEEEIASRKGWNKLKAVRNHRILCMDSNEITRPGPRLLDAAKQLIDFVYGEAQDDAA
ncbi:MAG: ABC transporter substrate-binding protein [Clostridia bacterium]|nr:ABC transporter substrate-binding protein [Clostridia bacterium]